MSPCFCFCYQPSSRILFTGPGSNHVLCLNRHIVESTLPASTVWSQDHQQQPLAEASHTLLKELPGTACQLLTSPPVIIISKCSLWTCSLPLQAPVPTNQANTPARAAAAASGDMMVAGGRGDHLHGQHCCNKHVLLTQYTELSWVPRARAVKLLQNQKTAHTSLEGL